MGNGPEASKGQFIKVGTFHIGPYVIFEFLCEMFFYCGWMVFVQAHYVGRLENGKVFDSSYGRGKPLTFRVGVGEVMQFANLVVVFVFASSILLQEIVSNFGILSLLEYKNITVTIIQT